MCTPYIKNYIEIVLPSPQIFDELCISYDKTGMFVTTLFRLLFYWILCTLIQVYFKKTVLMLTIFYILTAIIYINCFAMLIILIKKPKYEEYDS
jgi:hypothetical protein